MLSGLAAAGATGSVAGQIAKISIWVLIVLVPALILAAHVDLVAVAWVLLGHCVLTLVIQTALAKRFIGLTVGRQIRALLPVAVASVPAWVATAGVSAMSAGILALSCYCARRLEISYTGD